MSHQKTFYLGVLLNSCQFPGLSSPETIQQASLNWLPVSIMRGSTCEILARVGDAVLSDSAHSGGTAAMRSFQFALHRAWDRLDPEAFVWWSSEIRQDIFWWLDRERRELVILLERVSSQLDLWSNSSDVGWGSAPRRGGGFQPLVSRGVALLHPSIEISQKFSMRSSIFFRWFRTQQWRCMRTTRQRWPSCGIRGASDPRFLNWTAHDLMRWAERHSISLLPQFIMERNTVLADFFSRLNPILGSEWILTLSGFSSFGEGGQ